MNSTSLVLLTTWRRTQIGVHYFTCIKNQEEHFNDNTVGSTLYIAVNQCRILKIKVTSEESNHWTSKYFVIALLNELQFHCIGLYGVAGL